ncbi:MAG: ABC transporter ATP-binding protein [Lachnospiraceae bacterium]|nr:ABC transporter ATP-binding protein [Lachnospiraceae bacterium]
MSLLKLENIGKIYVSENNVAVGIRGVNLSFEQGEFVAITGASGSGKSTLLNVLSGMDTYEEGELYVEGQPTSHYLQTDWEEYRQKYISFIFQDYNIIDSFTVLQNVELALMTITDPIERRRRAIELIDRVGLRSHMRHKGSHLSGGQKQRTVIARALAKDSPIILADEPTGNLDSETSKEIIKLLREVSKDKLLIIVTHNFDQVEDVATRHIRVYDGSIESDHTLVETKLEEASENEPVPSTKRINSVTNGFLLGRSVFFAKPHLSIYLCLLMMIGAVAIFFVTTFLGDFVNAFKSNRFFRYEDGRVAFVHYSETPVTLEELEALKKKYGAKDSVKFDYLYDCRIEGLMNDWEYTEDAAEGKTIDGDSYGTFTCTFGRDYGTPDYGRYPENDAEAFLYLPLYLKENYTPRYAAGKVLEIGAANFRIVGVKFFLDSSETAQAVLTREGFDRASAGYALDLGAFANMQEDTIRYEYELFETRFALFHVGDHMPERSIYFSDAGVRNNALNPEITVTLRAFMALKRANSLVNQGHDHIGNACYIDIAKENILNKYDGVQVVDNNPTNVHVYISPDLAREMLDTVGAVNYFQATLLFDTEKQAVNAAKDLNENSFVALTSEDTYKQSVGTLIDSLITAGVQGLLWLVAIAFLAFFINLCSGRAVSTFRDDMAIMRSMGIPTKIIRIGIYVRMYLALIPAFITVPVLAYYVYRSPKLNRQLMYLHTWHYVIIFAGLILLTLFVTRRQCRKLFSQSVKKSLRGGAEN